MASRADRKYTSHFGGGILRLVKAIFLVTTSRFCDRFVLNRCFYTGAIRASVAFQISTAFHINTVFRISAAGIFIKSRGYYQLFQNHSTIK